MEKRLETITVDRIAQNMAGMDRHELRAHAGVALSTAYFTGYRHWAFSNVSREGPAFCAPGLPLAPVDIMFRMTAMAERPKCLQTLCSSSAVLQSTSYRRVGRRLQGWR